ncbi:uncharacterized protein LOC109851980 isoform X2 [Pseudomyrmex gracilis]|uniref:uncharacterized protein LOC109851980 isoform X2 n=1 Tax=Pseudomyrmex gracilis TaxID=219809 RepID=UPI000995CB11|nr:uncharacterized protein LOC109851980 isoform X2 [Pseudomyrmex gracilis]
MSLYKARKSTLRQSFASKLLARKTLLLLRPERLRGRYLFRSAVRRVMEYMEWIMGDPEIEEISDDVTVRIREATRKEYKLETKLKLQDRSVLLVRPSLRSRVDRMYIYDLIRQLRAYTKYPENLREDLATVCMYQYLPAGRTIVRQGYKAVNLYYIINGEVSLSRVEIDELTGDEKIVDMGILQSGDMFGEVALFHEIPRTATVVSKTSVDLLLIDQDDFNSILRSTLTKEWDVLRDALVHFDYFRTWDAETVRECCILSKLKEFKPNEILLGDGQGMVNYVHFILHGECRLIEHLLVRERSSYHGAQFELYNADSPGPQELRTVSKKPASSDKLKLTEAKLYNTFNETSNEINIESDRLSIVTTTLLDVVQAWHEITDVAAILMREPSVTSQLCYPSDVRTIFMQICIFSRGACLGLDGQRTNRI